MQAEINGFENFGINSDIGLIKLMDDALVKMGQAVYKDIQQKIDSGINPSGGSMPKNKPNTVASKRYHNSPNPTTYGKDTGKTMGSLRQSLRKGASGLSESVVYFNGAENARIAAYLNFGTKAHVIKAKNVPLLSFVTTKGRVQKKEVNHPGTPETQFFSISEEAETQLDKINGQFLEMVLEGLRK